MKNICYSIFFLVLLVSCNTKNQTASIYDFAPNNASVILNVNNVESLKSNLNNNAFLQSVSSASAYKSISKSLENLEYLNTSNPILISFLEDKNDSLQFVFATKQTSNLFQLDSIKNIKTEVIQIGGVSAKKITNKNHTIYATIKDSIAIAGSSKTVIENLLTQEHTNDELQQMVSTINKKKPLSVIINTKYGNTIKTLFNAEKLTTPNFSNYITMDVEVKQNEILLNGISKATDSTKSLVNVFKNTLPQENEMAKIAPSNSDGFLSLTFNDFKTFETNLAAFHNKDSIGSTNSLFHNIIEVGIIYQGEDNAVVLNSIDVISTKDALISEHNISETYRQVDIYNFSKPALFEQSLSPFITFKDASFYCIIDQFFVFGNSIESLQNIIANYQNETTLSSRSYYKDIATKLSDESSILQIVNPSILKSILAKNLGNDLKSSFKPYNATTLQFIYDTNFAHVNAIIKKSKTKAVENSVTEILNIKLDADILNTPQLVTNHRTKEKEIVVQDINNKLYLISNKGNILWKKQLRGAILGKIEQIDTYKNGRLQLTFATPKRVYVIARNGKDVDGFPLKFNDEITQPLSVFDYDKNKKYRLFVTQGKNVLLYDAKGKTVRGFQFKSAKETINHQPQHIRIRNKDYVIIKTGKKLNILTRKGKPRVTPKTQVNYSNQAVYKYNNTFTTTDSDGNLITIDQKGNLSSKYLSLAQGHHITTTSKTLVAQTENKLTIKSRTLELDFGKYTEPQLFYIKDKIYVSVTDLQSQKVLLFDSQAKSITNFPVYGNSAITLDNIDKDRNLEFVTKGENNSILVYEIN